MMRSWRYGAVILGVMGYCIDELSDMSIAGHKLNDEQSTSEGKVITSSNR